MKTLALYVVRRLGRLIEHVGHRMAHAGRDKSPFATFLTDEALAINRARQVHLASLELPIAGKSVLEVGAGIGLHTKFFEDLNCRILSTDGRIENVAEMRRRYPMRNIQLLNLQEIEEYHQLGHFDIVYCYGLLYHTTEPEKILQGLAAICREMILLETCVTPGSHLDMHLIREGPSYSQALGGIGCRPTRPWIMEKLRAFWGYAYVTRTQPRHPEFDLDWVIPPKQLNHRAVFVGSKRPLNNLNLLDYLPDHQSYW